MLFTVTPGGELTEPFSPWKNRSKSGDFTESNNSDRVEMLLERNMTEPPIYCSVSMIDYNCGL